MQRRESEAESSLPAAFRQTADSLVSLVAAHVHIAKLELTAEINARARRLVSIATIVAVAAFGYALIVVGIGLSGVLHITPPAGFLILGGIHLGLAVTAAAIIAAGRRTDEDRVDGVVQAVATSVTTVANAAVSGRAARSKAELARAAA